MKVKAVQIAKELGISKATVSLALNGKPGVSEKTKEEVFRCKDRLENKELHVKEEEKQKKTIKVIRGRRGKEISYDSLVTDVLEVFDWEAKKRGYELGIKYMDVRDEDIGAEIQECNAPNVAGVILHATELNEADISKFEEIKAPLVIYDNESTDSRHNCVVADNRLGVMKAVKYLMERGLKNIIYLANTEMIYNFQERRLGFSDALLRYNMNPYQEDRLVMIGNTIEQVYRKMLQYLDERELPDAFISENYQISVGMMRAFRERNIKVPEQVSVIGVDKIPSYMTGDCQLTTVCIPHVERAVLAMMLLDKEIESQSTTKSRIMTDCRLFEGESVRQ